jgi:hypothetical protein
MGPLLYGMTHVHCHSDCTVCGHESLPQSASLFGTQSVLVRHTQWVCLQAQLLWCALDEVPVLIIVIEPAAATPCHVVSPGELELASCHAGFGNKVWC